MSYSEPSTPEVLSLSSHENDEEGDDDDDNETEINNNNNIDVDGGGDDVHISSTCIDKGVKNTQTIHHSSSRVDHFLTVFGKFTEKSIYTERGIKLLQWTIWLISQLTKNNQRLPKECSPSFRKLYSDLSNMRYILRFYGFPGSWAAVRKPGCWAGSPPYALTWKDGRIQTLADVMAWSMFFYHPLEHVAFAKWSMPKLVKGVDGNKLSAWSCRCWLVYIVSDWAGSYLKNRELSNRRKLLLACGNQNDDDDDMSAKEIKDIEQCMKNNRLQMVRNFFFTPPCLNWSLDKWATDPLLSENVVNGFSLLEAIVCIYQSVLTL